MFDKYIPSSENIIILEYKIDNSMRQHLKVYIWRYCILIGNHKVYFVILVFFLKHLKCPYGQQGICVLGISITTLLIMYSFQTKKINFDAFLP